MFPGRNQFSAVCCVDTFQIWRLKSASLSQFVFFWTQSWLYKAWKIQNLPEPHFWGGWEGRRVKNDWKHRRRYFSYLWKISERRRHTACCTRKGSSCEVSLQMHDGRTKINSMVGNILNWHSDNIFHHQVVWKWLYWWVDIDGCHRSGTGKAGGVCCVDTRAENEKSACKNWSHHHHVESRVLSRVRAARKAPSLFL